MANRTVKDAHSVRGTNPQYLVEKIIRSRIYDSRYWKEECFALSAELLVDKAMELKYVGGVFGGNIKPTPFLCLVLKMLQIQPEKDIIVEFIRQEDFKYVRALGAFYMRLVGTSLDCYKYLEPLYNDYRKVRKQNRQGIFEVVFMDEYIDELLHSDRVCDVILPRIQKRQVLEENNELEARISALEDDLEEPESDDDDEKEVAFNTSERLLVNYQRRETDRNRVPVTSSPPQTRRRRSRSPHKRGHSPRRRSRERERHRHRSRSREKDRGKTRDKDRRHRSRSPAHDKRGHEKRSSHHSKHSHRSRDHREKDKNRSITQEEFEIAEANALRSKLGLPPLRA